MEIVENDILVIGGGGGGAYAAYEASKSGRTVTLAVKGFFGKSGSTPLALGALAAVGPWSRKGDSLDVHLEDTLRGGAFLNDRGLVRKMVEEAPKRILELESLGALWERGPDGKEFLLRQGGGHAFPRSPYLEDRPGHELLKVLKGELLRRKVRVCENQMVLKILTHAGRTCGAVSLGTYTGEFTVYRAKAVILATGGSSQLYPCFTQDVKNTADGFCLGWDAGADLMDLEFLQFFIGLAWPEALRGIIVGTLYYGRLLNREGERFLERYDPVRLESSTRDIVTRACYQEIQEGRGTPRGGVYLDLSHNPPGFVPEQLPMIYTLCGKLGVDLEKDPMEVAPTFHFIMGGIRVDGNWESSVPGLFAVGEVAGGVHGANRLSQNSLSDILVSGGIAGRAAADLAGKRKFAASDPAEWSKVSRKVEAIFERKPMPAFSLRDLKNKLRGVMWDKVSFRRNEKGLNEALAEVQRLREDDLPRVAAASRSRRFNYSLIEILEAENLLTFAELVIYSARERRETRGAHFREDFPKQDDANWLKHVVLRRGPTGCQMRTEEVAP